MMIKRFLHHINIHPSKLKENEIKPHLYTLLKKLDFLTLVEDYLNKKLGNVRTEEQARRVFTLLDLLSAQEPLRMRYLKQVCSFSVCSSECLHWKGFS
ncbi:hypothetical protein E2C01_059050 [Portunus trituberculatus]|uniref:Uncharacterized protein n=1 Tax=Portunus trituberculatus TaxID=210409 RepID=A0A5B7H7A8_PORTR|nr:hypothetical protein [Portunus trituberculatus]